MRHLVSVAVLAVAMSVPTPALSENLAGLKCETQQMKELILKLLKNAIVDGGYNLTSYGISIKGISKVSTLTSNKTKLICKLLTRVNYSGSAFNLRGRLVITAFSGERYTARWIED